MHWFLVAMGGAVGATIRYGAYLWIETRISKSPETVITHLPGIAGTWFVNAIGCLLIGLISGALGDKVFTDERLRAFLIVGLFGGFTTMSALGLESWNLLRDGQLLKGFSLSLVQTMLCVFMVGLGIWVGKFLKLS